VKVVNNVHLVCKNLHQIANLYVNPRLLFSGNVTDYKSTSGFIIKFGTGLIGWGCKKQSCAALSSTDAECIAMSECCRELSWLFELLNCLDVKPHLPIITVQQIENHGNKHWAHYAGLIESDEK
jgi:hypothetical protein